jgi:hypothetical protein
VRENLCAVYALPEERIVGQAVVLTPANLDRHKKFQTSLMDQLRERPGIAKDIRQPQDGALRIFSEMLTEERAPQQELTSERLGAAEIAISFDPHAADRFPASFFDSFFDRFK